ncbi:MAG: hypothetical protein ACK4V6_10840 [Microthrixaceae bacterium]
MSRTDDRRLVVATESTSLAADGERLLRLVRWIQLADVRVELLALSDGPDTEAFDAVVPTTVLRRLPGPVLGGVAAVAPARVSQGLRGRALRRWMSDRRGVDVLVHQARAASVLRYGGGTSSIVAMLTGPSSTLASLRPEDHRTLSGAAGWLVTESEQAAEIAAELGSPCTVIGPMLHPSDLPAVTVAGADGAVVMVPTPDTWSAVNHTVEVALALAAARPDTQLRWTVASDEDEWLARHDVAHAGLEDRVQVVAERSHGVLDDVGAVVRTGYGTSPSPLVVAARLAGVPVTGFSVDASPTLGPSPELDVEHLVAATTAVLDPDERARRGVVPGAGFGPDPQEVVAELLGWFDSARSEQARLSAP